MNTHTRKAIEAFDIANELFGDHLSGFQQHLIDQSHAEGTVKQYIRCISALAEIMKAEKIAVEDLDEAQALELVTRAGWIKSRRIYVR